MKNNSIFVHAGWNKTATTFLQRDIFTPIFDTALIGPNKKFNDLQRLKYQHSTPLLISDESLLGVTFSDYVECRNIQRFNFLDNWSRLAPNSKFIICIRQHSDFLESLYRQYLHVGGYLKPNKFVDILNDHGYIKRDELLYAPILNRLSNCFEGPHFIYDFDSFKTNQEFYVEKLIQFLGLDVCEFQHIIKESDKKKKRNSSVNYRSGLALRFVNKFVSSKLYPDKPVPVEFFQLLAFGKTPRRLFQRGSKEHKKHYFTKDIFDSLQPKFSEDWEISKNKFVTVDHQFNE